MAPLQAAQVRFGLISHWACSLRRRLPCASRSCRPTDETLPPPALVHVCCLHRQARHAVFSTELLTNAYMLAARFHAGQTRANGETMLSHCLETAYILADLGLDAETVAAGLLHEGFRSTPLARCQLEEFMPAQVVQLVDRSTAMSEISRLYRHHRSSMNEEDLQRMMLAMQDVNAVLVKLAERLHDMRTISCLPADKQQRLAQETLDVFSVVANRLGVWCLKAELEDAAFAVLQPQQFRSLKEQVSHRLDTDALGATLNKLKERLDAAGIAYEDISGRPKNLWGIYKKTRGGALSADQIYDLCALRVIVANKHDCFRVHRVLRETYRPVSPSRYKDFITTPKKTNGYQVSERESSEGWTGQDGDADMT